MQINYKYLKDQEQYFILYLFRYLPLTVIVITIVQCFEFPSNKNISDNFCIKGHIANTLPLTFQMNYSSMDLVLIEKLSNIKLSRLIFHVTTFLQFSYTQASLNILLQYAHDLEGNIQTLYARLVTKNDNQKSYEAPQWNLTYVSLLTSCSQELNSYKHQMIVLYMELHNMFNTFDQSNHSQSKCGIIHSLFNFLFGTSSSTEEINAIKNNKEILKAN